MKTTRRDFLGKRLIGVAGGIAMSVGLPVLVKEVVAKVPESNYLKLKTEGQLQVDAILHSYNKANQGQFVIYPSVKAKLDEIQWQTPPDVKFQHLSEVHPLTVNELPPHGQEFVETAEAIHIDEYNKAIQYEYALRQYKKNFSIEVSPPSHGNNAVTNKGESI